MTSPTIRALIRPDAAAFTARLAAKARGLAEARAEERRRSGPSRWRTPRLLWPLF